MKSRRGLGLLAAICALGTFAGAAHADDRDQFRQRVYERTHENHDRRDDHRDSGRDNGHYYGRDDHRDSGRDYDRHDYDHRRDYDRHRDVVEQRHFDRDHDRRREVIVEHRYDRGYYDRGYDHPRYYERRYVESYPRFSYYDRFDRRLVPSLQRGFYCDDFHHFRGPHYHVSRTDFYSSFYPLYPYRPYYDQGGSLSVIVSIPF